MDRADEIARNIGGVGLEDRIRNTAATLRNFRKTGVAEERDRCHKIATHVEFPSGRHLTWQEIADRIKGEE